MDARRLGRVEELHFVIIAGNNELAVVLALELVGVE